MNDDEMNKRYESHIWEDEYTTQALRSGQDAMKKTIKKKIGDAKTKITE